MKKFIVLLRGVNVGGNNLLPMKELRSHLERAGFESVRTYIQSGNIVLSCANDPGAEVSELIQEQFGFKPNVMVLTEDAFNTAAKNNPYQESEGKLVHFYFCKDKPDVDFARIEDLCSDTEQYELVGNVFYLHAPDGIGRSKLAAKAEACLGVAATGRNLNTVNKLREITNDCG